MTTELLVAVLSILGATLTLFIGSYLQRKTDRLRIQTEALRSKKFENYFEILWTMMQAVASPDDKRIVQKAITEITSPKYKHKLFELILIGSDGVVTAINNFFQYIYLTDESERDGKLMLGFLGNIILEVRKDLGQKGTSQDQFSILEYQIKDINEVRKEKQGEFKKIIKKLSNHESKLQR